MSVMQISMNKSRLLLRACPMALCLFTVLMHGCAGSNKPSCRSERVAFVRFAEHSDYELGLSDGRSYQRDPHDTGSYSSGKLVTSKEGDFVFVCRSRLDPKGIEIVSDQESLRYPSDFTFRVVKQNSVRRPTAKGLPKKKPTASPTSRVQS
jgi:hypothetical protein